MASSNHINCFSLPVSPAKGGDCQNTLQHMTSNEIINQSFRLLQTGIGKDSLVRHKAKANKDICGADEHAPK